MKYSFFSILVFFALFMACQNSVTNSAKTANSKQETNQKETTQTIETDEEVWTPTAIEDCISTVNVGEPFELETSFNPFYLRADFDNNKLVDYAVLIKGKKTKKRGVIICRDSIQPFIFGQLANLKVPLSSFENDNFVTNQWEIATKDETKNRIVRHTGGVKMSSDAKGESIEFLFEGGEGVVIYWDGKGFKVNG
jgi:hypothetical protein